MTRSPSLTAALHRLREQVKVEATVLFDAARELGRHVRVAVDDLDGGRTRAHHRRCPKRGNREQASEALKRWMLERATRAAAIDAKREAQMTAIEQLLSAATPSGVTLAYERPTRIPSRARRVVDGMGGIMADVAGKAAGEMQARVAEMVRGSFLDSVPPEWLAAEAQITRSILGPDEP